MKLASPDDLNLTSKTGPIHQCQVCGNKASVLATFPAPKSFPIQSYLLCDNCLKDPIWSNVVTKKEIV